MGTINEKSGAEKLARGAQMVKGAAKIVGGIVSGNYLTAVKGTAEALSPKIIAIILAICIFFTLLPVLIILSIPQMLFGWGTTNDEELMKRNAHGAKLEKCYNDILGVLSEEEQPDKYWLIAIESVLHKQNVEEISEEDVKKSVERGYKVSDDGKTITSKSAEEIMDELGFTDDEKNWAGLMYQSMNEQYLEPGSEYGDITYNGDDSGSYLGGGSVQEVVYFNQLDKRWADIRYGKTGTIGSSGCGPTALAIVVSTFKSSSVNPVDVSNWSVKNGHRCEGNGSYHSLIPNGAKHYGLDVEKLGRSSAKEIAEHLSNGRLIIAIMAKGHFTSSGHFIVLRGITDKGKVLVADPASTKRSNMEWDMSIILKEARGSASAGGPFWSIGV